MTGIKSPQGEQNGEIAGLLSQQDSSVSPEDLRKLAESTFRKLQECWQARAYDPMKPLLMPDLFNQHTAQLSGMVANHEINRIENVRVERVDLVNKGQSYIVDVSSSSLSDMIAGKRLEATTDQSRVKKVDAVCICVPTPLTKTKDPELSYVVSESETVSKYLQRGQLVVLESTTYPGTTQLNWVGAQDTPGQRGTLPTFTSANAYFVSKTSGNDANPGTQAAPKATLGSLFSVTPSLVDWSGNGYTLARRVCLRRPCITRWRRAISIRRRG
jgi:hypothetical protein